MLAMITPRKDAQIGDGAFSPVHVLESPSAVSPQKNWTGNCRVARDISADIYNNIQQWNKYHIQGAAIVKQIAVLKTESPESYPEGLETLSDQLSAVVLSIQKISGAFNTSCRQLEALSKLHKTDNPLFLSWPVHKMVSIARNVSEKFQQECQVKTCVAENISHPSGKDLTMFFAACWVHQPYITDNLSTDVESLLVEVGHRSVT